MMRALVIAVAVPVLSVAGMSAPRAAPGPSCVSVPDFTTYAPQATTRRVTVTTTACGFDLANGYSGSDSVWLELGTPSGATMLLRNLTGWQDGVTFTKQLNLDRTAPVGRWTVDNVIVHDA